MFIEALFTIARTWKQPKYPSTEEWIKMMWHIYSGKLLNHKKTWMDLETQSEETQKDKHHLILLIYGM